MDKIFRLAQEEDYPQIIQLFKEATDHMCSQGIYQWDEIYPAQEHLRRDITKQHMYMLVCDGETVSAAVINDEQDDEYNSVDWKYKGERTGVIHRLCVSPSHQQRGYGKETILRSERVMKEAGYTAVRLDAFSQNPSALKLYEGLGYERVGEVTFRKGRFFVYEKLLRCE